MRICAPDFKKPSDKTTNFYDLLADYPLIEASFLEQYGIRLSEVNMSWREFSDLLACLSSETPLGRVIAIRSETNNDAINGFSKAQRAIYDEWNDTKPAGVDELFAVFRKGVV